MENICFREVAHEVRKASDGSRKMTFIASDSSRDSAHTVLNMDGWDLTRFNNNGIIGYQHNVYGSYGADTENPDNVIGKGHAYIEDGKLMVDVEFEPESINPLAEKVYQKLLFGSLKAVSVGFMPIGRGTWGKGDEAIGGTRETYYYAGQELLEVSVVNIPANPNALKKAFDTEIKGLKKQDAPAPKEEPKEDRSLIDFKIKIAEAALL